MFDMLFLRLPVEIRLKIKETIPFWDLRTHAAFYLTHEAIATLYDSASDPDEFWKSACWYNGIGILPDEEDKADDLRWKDIALDCFLRDGFCNHPACGERLLKYNRLHMLDAFYREHLEPYQAAHIRGETSPVKLAGHRIFRWIAFRPSREVQFANRSFPVSHDAHLLYEEAWDDARFGEVWCGPPFHQNPLGPEGDVGETREYIAQHPLVARSFACFFPVDDISFCYVHDVDLIDHQWYPDVDRPVTVLDVLRILHQNLDYKLQLQDMRIYVRDHERCLEERGWGLSDSLNHVHTMRDTFSACRLRELKFICIEDEVGPAFSFEQV